ncbi:MAG TPA: DUF3221 domain-containing protein [Clostridia bacterium]|nr:DUF3221 domain-containing protein [Clostridia bacterium]
MKKWILLLFLLPYLLSGCSKKINMDNFINEPNFSGIVQEVSSHSILVKVNKEESELLSSDLISLSLDAKLEKSARNFNVGDEVRVYYNGNIAESYPAQVSEVYAIILVNPARE